MIKAQHNILGFYDNILARIGVDNGSYSDSIDNKDVLVKLATNTMPAIQLLVDDATTATIQLLDEDDADVGSALSMIVTDLTSYKRLNYLSTSLSGNSCGIYSLKIINGLNTYYSDQFMWEDSVSEYLKISAVSSDVKLGGTYVVDLTNFTYEFYLSADYIGIEHEMASEDSEKLSVPNVLYADFKPTRQFGILCTENTYRFLSGLRILESNGTVTIEYGYISYTANDILVDAESNGTTMSITLKFIDKSEILSVSNNI